MIQKFADAGPDKLGAFGGGLEIAKWSEAFEAVGRELAKVADELRVAHIELSEIDEQINALEASNRSPAGAQPARDVVIDLEAAAPGKAKITVTYQVRGASWRPGYDVRLVTDKGAKAQMELVRRALVRQRTGEDWTGAEIAVSTSRPNRGTKAPDVLTERMAFFDAEAMARDRAKFSAQRTAPAREAMVAAAPAPAAAPPMRAAVEQEAVLDAGDYEAVFRIPGRIDIPATAASARCVSARARSRRTCRCARRRRSTRPPISKPRSRTPTKRPCCPATFPFSATACSWGAGSLRWSRPAPRRALGLARTSA